MRVPSCTSGVDVYYLFASMTAAPIEHRGMFSAFDSRTIANYPIFNNDHVFNPSYDDPMKDRESAWNDPDFDLGVYCSNYWFMIGSPNNLYLLKNLFDAEEQIGWSTCFDLRSWAVYVKWLGYRDLFLGQRRIDPQRNSAGKSCRQAPILTCPHTTGSEGWTYPKGLYIDLPRHIPRYTMPDTKVIKDMLYPSYMLPLQYELRQPTPMAPYQNNEPFEVRLKRRRERQEEERKLIKNNRSRLGARRSMLPRTRGTGGPSSEDH